MYWIQVQQKLGLGSLLKKCVSISQLTVVPYTAFSTFSKYENFFLWNIKSDFYQHYTNTVAISILSYIVDTHYVMTHHCERHLSKSNIHKNFFLAKMKWKSVFCVMLLFDIFAGRLFCVGSAFIQREKCVNWL